MVRPKRGQALNSAARQRAQAVALAASSDSAAPPEQPDDGSAAADAASPDNAAAVAESAAADALRASAQGISGGSAGPAPPAITDSEAAEPTSKAESPRKAQVSTLPGSELQGQALDADAGPGRLRGIFSFQRREAERAESEKPPDWDRFVDRERSWTGEVAAAPAASLDVRWLCKQRHGRASKHNRASITGQQRRCPRTAPAGTKLAHCCCAGKYTIWLTRTSTQQSSS